jgi:polar amino acid transport system substrate-binding protein
MLTKPLSIAAILVLAGAAVAGAADPSSPAKPPLRVGISPNSPPMAFKEGKTIVGVEPDLAQLVGRELGRPVQFVELRWEDLFDALEQQKADIIMSAVSVTRARMMRMAFSDPYVRVGQMALVRGDEKYRYALLENSLADQTLGVKKATTADILVQQDFPRAKRKYFESGEEAAKALVKKRIDLFFSDSTVIWYLAGKFESQGLVALPSVFSDETLAWPMRRSDTQLIEAVNRALKSIMANGELNQVLRRWMPKFE